MPETVGTNRLVFLHGFTQTHHHWHSGALAIGAALGSRPSLAFVDLPGHGLSDADQADITSAAGALPALAGRGTWVGYSMGGRHALLAAVSGAPEIERLVLIGATAGLDDSDERAERAKLDRERADRIEAIGVDAFVDEWLGAPMFSRLPRDERDVSHRRRNTAAGLAHSLRTASTGVQPAIWDRLEAIEIPVLVLAGEHDRKFTDLGRSLAERIPGATFTSVAGAGHAAHTEQPAATAAIVARWLRAG